VKKDMNIPSRKAKPARDEAHQRAPDPDRDRPGGGCLQRPAQQQRHDRARGRQHEHRDDRRSHSSAKSTITKSSSGRTVRLIPLARFSSRERVDEREASRAHREQPEEVEQIHDQASLDRRSRILSHGPESWPIYRCCGSYAS